MACRLLVLLLSACGAVQALTIATDGRGAVPVVVATGATAPERHAARELADYLGRATGGTFPIVEEAAAPAGPAIRVGPTRAATGLTPAGSEAWLVRLVGDQLVITGGRPRGTLYAAYHFLEDVVGVHWWTPWDETVPRRATLAIESVDLRGEPKFRYRDVYDALPEPKPFQARNRLNGHFSGVGAEYGGTLAYGPPYHVHTFNRYFPPAEYFAKHPEWYSEIDGQRRAERSQLCLTNAALLGEMIAKVRATIARAKEDAEQRGVPAPVVFDVSQNDWYGQCACAKCRQLVEAEGSEAGPLLAFVNAIADAVKDEYPWVYIDTLAYQYTLDPPRTIRPRDNVIIRLCDLSNPDQAQAVTHPNNQKFHDSVLAWSKIAKNLRIWDYAVTYGDHQGLPFPNLFTMAPDYRFFLEHQAEGLFIEHEYPVTADLRDLKTWVQAKLLEDPYQDDRALVATFTDGYYGAAGPLVRQYVQALEDAARRVPSFIAAFGGAQQYGYLDLELLTTAHRLFDQAEAAVANDAVLAARVRHARLPIDRATLLRWRTLCQEHLAAGGAPATMPLDREAVGQRCLDTLLTQTARRTPEPQRAAEQARYRAQIGGLLALPGFVAPPALLKDVAPARLNDFTPDTFRLWQNQAKVVSAADAELGATARLLLTETPPARRDEYLVTPQRGLPWGVYDTVNKRTIASGTLRWEDVKASGYQVLKLPGVNLTRGCYVYFFWSWVVQCDVPVATEGQYDVYAWVKLEGPGFPQGDPNQPNAISVQRVVLVKAE